MASQYDSTDPYDSATSAYDFDFLVPRPAFEAIDRLPKYESADALPVYSASVVLPSYTLSLDIGLDN